MVRGVEGERVDGERVDGERVEGERVEGERGGMVRVCSHCAGCS